MKLEPKMIARFQAVREQLYATGFSALHDHDAELALHAFGVMAAMCPVDQRPWLGLGAVHEQREKWEQAVAFYQVAQRLAPRSVWPLLGCARMRSKLGQWQEAQRALDSAEQLFQGAVDLDQIAQLTRMTQLRGDS